MKTRSLIERNERQYFKWKMKKKKKNEKENWSIDSSVVQNAHRRAVLPRRAARGTVYIRKARAPAQLSRSDFPSPPAAPCPSARASPLQLRQETDTQPQAVRQFCCRRNKNVIALYGSYDAALSRATAADCRRLPFTSNVPPLLTASRGEHVFRGVLEAWCIFNHDTASDYIVYVALQSPPKCQ